jgi:membrane protease YdiL (CAAX protease family)
MAGPARRYAEGSICVAGWAGLGWLLRLEAEAYLVAGVPITFAFQRLVRGQPLRAMWVAAAPPFRLDWKGKGLALGLAAVPLAIAISAASGHHWSTCAWGLAAVGGAVAAAYALRHFRRPLVGPLLSCLAINTALDAITWTILSLSGGFEAAADPPGPGGRIAIGLGALVVYFPVVFMMEEVFFRGVLDPHVHRPGEGRGWGSALFVSALWGLWHLPIAGDAGPGTIAVLLFVHCPFGVVLSMYWRRSGTLVVPGLSHAFSDALRDALFTSA